MKSDVTPTATKWKWTLGAPNYDPLGQYGKGAIYPVPEVLWVC